MPNDIEYHKSVSAEFKAYEKRVRNLIDAANWAEEGRYKEIILSNYLRRILPKNVSIGTGFVRNGHGISTQIDIIIYDSSYPVLFSEGDFIVTIPDNVIGIIEVKSNIRPSEITGIMQKAAKNAAFITQGTDKQIFNGIFSYNADERIESYVDYFRALDMEELLTRTNFNELYPRRLNECVNHIVLGDSLFIKFWEWSTNTVNNELYSLNKAKYSFYNLSMKLAISYFLSNLHVHIIKNNNSHRIDCIPDYLSDFLFPLPEGKTAHTIEDVFYDYQ